MPQMTNAHRPYFEHDPERPAMAPAKAGERYYNGQMVNADENGFAVPGADVAGHEFLGVLIEPILPDSDEGGVPGFHLDNLFGPNGVVDGDGNGSTRIVRYDSGRRYAFRVMGTPPKPGADCYQFDDETYTADVTNVRLGKFVRPGPGGTWFADFHR